MARHVKADAAGASETLLKLAVLLQAGVAPARAWGYLATTGDASAVRVCAAVESGMPLHAAIATAGDAPAQKRETRVRRVVRRRVDAASRVDRDSSKNADVNSKNADVNKEWSDIAVAWHVATAVGAPLAQSLRSLAMTLRDAQEAADDIRVALAEPAATARLMGWLPLVAVVLGIALGFDTIGTLLGNPLGIACLIAGVALVVLGRRWNSVLVRRARAGSGIPGLEAEMLAIALSGGVSIERARRLVSDAESAARKSPDVPKKAPPATGADGETDAVLVLSQTAGVPAVELLRASAALTRHRARIEGRLRAAKLSSRLLLPLGVCTLPAFLLLGVAPMLLSVMATVSIPL